MEEARSRNLKAPYNVQELAKQQVGTILLRYIHDDIETISDSSMLLPEIPVIDMLAIGDDNSELQRLHFACKEWGYFQLVNHGVSSSLVEKVKSEIQAFFNLPMEEKKKFEQQEGDVEGYGQDVVFTEEQKDIMEEYCKEMKSLTMIIIRQLGKALRMDEKEMRDLSNDGMLLIRMNYYPPCHEPDKTIGVSPHSDTDALTILLQLNETDGLQVRKDHIWVPIKPLPNAFIVN
ncbi:hypothetical protein MTR67_009085 [Solanum verrucosum]|uniref:Fe2OG dioxygenase domain-containing protein n=1 Tax=Solanum verrucosum TaxID=315347 RepID=A0AAF0TJZ6_SOLVR|nr:hypothetical protein MTR67_009085 [Solanum verrucosum]